MKILRQNCCSCLRRSLSLRERKQIDGGKKSLRDRRLGPTKPAFLAGGLLLAGGLQVGCSTSRESPRLQTLQTNDYDSLEWDEIIESRAGLFVQPVNSEYLPPPAISSLVDNQLLLWTESLKIKNPRDYEGGVYGKVGNATVYITSRSKISDFDRLHWVMVKVLSEKYGCFIVGKNASERDVTVRCRDKRRIVFKRSLSDQWIMFYGRQYDTDGREIIIASRGG